MTVTNTYAVIDCPDSKLALKLALLYAYMDGCTEYKVYRGPVLAGNFFMEAWVK